MSRHENQCVADGVIINNVAGLERCIEKIRWTTGARSLAHIVIYRLRIQFRPIKPVKPRSTSRCTVVRKQALEVPQDSRDLFDLMSTHSPRRRHLIRRHSADDRVSHRRYSIPFVERTLPAKRSSGMVA